MVTARSSATAVILTRVGNVLTRGQTAGDGLLTSKVALTIKTLGILAAKLQSSSVQLLSVDRLQFSAMVALPRNE
jgi:hypothetical protein